MPGDVLIGGVGDDPGNPRFGFRNAEPDEVGPGFVVKQPHLEAPGLAPPVSGAAQRPGLFVVENLDRREPQSVEPRARKPACDSLLRLEDDRFECLFERRLSYGLAFDPNEALDRVPAGQRVEEVGEQQVVVVGEGRSGCGARRPTRGL